MKTPVVYNENDVNREARKGTPAMEKMQFTAWELSLIEIALRSFDKRAYNDLAKKQIEDLANRVANATSSAVAKIEF